VFENHSKNSIILQQYKVFEISCQKSTTLAKEKSQKFEKLEFSP